MNRPLFLVGFMGSGKSAVGRQVAGELGLGFRDSDELAVRFDGRSVERIFSEDGEAAFRRVESLVVEQLCSGEPLVVATGGGAFLSYRSRRMMIGAGLTVWLDVPLPTISTRLAGDRYRPVWNPEDRTGMRRLYEKRRPAYALAERRVDGSDLGSAAGEIIRLVRER